MEILKYQYPALTLVQKSDNTLVSRPIIPVKATLKLKEIYEASLHPGLKKIIVNGKSIWVKDKNESVSSEKRPAALVKKHSEEGKAKHDYQKHKELEEKINQGILGAAALGGLALAQATPAAPYVDAALAVHGGIGLAKQANDGTLGFNTETAWHVLETLPLGIRSGIGMWNKLGRNIYNNLKYPIYEVGANGKMTRVWLPSSVSGVEINPNTTLLLGEQKLLPFSLWSELPYLQLRLLNYSPTKIIRLYRATDNTGNITPLSQKYNFSNPDTKYLTEGEIVYSPDGVAMEVTPYKGTKELLTDNAINAAVDAILYPQTKYFENRAIKSGVFNESELPLLLKELQEANTLENIISLTYDEGLKYRGLNSPRAEWDSNGNVKVLHDIKVNPDFHPSNSDIMTTMYHEVGGHGFNSAIAGNENPDIVKKLQNLKLLGISDELIFNAAKSYIQKTTGTLSEKEANDISWGYTFATKYPMIYRMLRYNYELGKKTLQLKPNVDTSTPEFRYKSDPDELSTRARTGHIKAAVLKKDFPAYTTDIRGLETYFTPESIKKFLEKVLSIGIPTLITAGAIKNASKE